MSTEFHTRRQVQEAIGADLGISQERIFSQSTVDAFADLTGDHQWIHSATPQTFQESPYGGPIVHGALLLALIPVFAAELAVFPKSATIINVGMDRARLRTPVRVDSGVSAAATLTAATPMDRTDVLVEIAVRLSHEASPHPVCMAVQKFLIKGLI